METLNTIVQSTEMYPDIILPYKNAPDVASSTGLHESHHPDVLTRIFKESLCPGSMIKEVKALSRGSEDLKTLPLEKTTLPFYFPLFLLVSCILSATIDPKPLGGLNE